MGQFTGLLKEIGTKEAKPNKGKASKTAQNNGEKVTAKTTTAAPAKALKTVKAKPETKKPSGSDATAPMRGKRSHPDYTQAPAFVRKDTYKAVKIALLNDERGLDYSDLVEKLLTDWLKDKR